MTVTVKRDEVLYLREGKDAESFQKHKIWNFREKVRYREKSRGNLKCPA